MEHTDARRGTRDVIAEFLAISPSAGNRNRRDAAGSNCSSDKRRSVVYCSNDLRRMYRSFRSQLSDQEKREQKPQKDILLSRLRGLSTWLEVGLLSYSSRKHKHSSHVQT